MTERRIAPGQLATIAVLTLAGSLLWTLVFDARDIAALLIGAVVGATVVTVALHIKGRPHAAVSTAASAVGLGVVLTITTRGVDLGAWREGLVRGWSGILSATVPAPGSPEFLVMPVVLTWLAAFVAAEVTIRTRSILGPIAPAVLLGASAFLFALDGPGRSLVLPMGFIVVAGVFVLLRSTAQSEGPNLLASAEPGAPSSAALRRRRIVTALPLVALIAAGSVLLGSALPFLSADEPLQLRDYWRTDDRVEPSVNPLGLVTRAAASAAPDTPAKDRPRRVFSVTLDRVPSSAPRFRLITLDRFDQLEWTASPRFIAAGRRVPESSNDVERTTPVTQRITLDRLDGSWLPALDRPDTVDAPLAAHLQVETKTGGIARGELSRRNLSYEVRSKVPEADFGAIAATATPGTDQEALDALQIPPEVPQSLQRIAQQLGENSGSSWQQLARLIAFFDPKQGVEIDGKVIEFTQDPTTTLGHSMASLDQFVTTKPAGTSEQYATAFTVLARLMKFPARVVVGYVPSGEIVANRRVDVMSSDLQAWAEVNLAGHGWVTIPFGFTPDGGTPPELPPEVDATVSKTVDTPTDPNRPVDRVVSRPPVKTSDPGLGLGAKLLIALGVILSAILLICSPFIVKRLRRLRRARRGTPADRVVGAWTEALDRLREAGVSQVATLVPTEAAHLSETTLGLDDTEHLRELGTIVLRALHAPAEPDDQDADAAWAAERRFESDVSAARTPRQRARSALDPRPLMAADRA